MEGLQNRIDSFSKPKRVKNPAKPSSNLTLKWPHPNAFTANPDTLAEAGFYFNPSAEDPDNVTCFMCEKQLSDWEAEDDPFDIHFDKCANKCSWANIRCGLRRDVDRHGRFVFPDKARLPASKAMEKARLETFSAGAGWIHDKARNHGASSKKLAQAGFVCMSNYPGDDLASCLYCNVSLSGWDKDDNPMEEHRKRKDKSGYSCPFFANANLETPSSDSGQSTKPASKASSSTKPPSRTASKSKLLHQDMIMPTKVFDGDPDGDLSDSAKSTTSTKTPSRKSRAPSGSTKKSSAKTPRSRSTSRSLKNVMEVDEDDEPEEEPPATVKKKTTTRARSKSVARSAPSEAGDDVEEPIVAPPTTAKKKKKAGKAAAKSVVSDDEEVEELSVAPPTTVKKKKATTVRSRSKSVAKSGASEADDDDVEEPVAPAPTTAKKKANTARSRSKSVAISEKSDLDDTPAVEDTVRKSSRAKGKGKAPTPSETEAEGEEEEPALRKSSRAKTKTAGPTTAKKPAASSRAKAKAKTVDPEPEDEAEEDEGDALVYEPPKHRAASKKPPSTTSKSKGKAKKAEQDPISEDEFGPIIEQPPFAPAATAKAKAPSSIATAKKQPLAGAASIGKGKPPSSRSKPAPVPVDPPSQTDEDDELGSYVPPPLPPPSSSANDVDEDVEMTPLVIPKRTAAIQGKVNAAAREWEERRHESETSAVQKTVTKAKRPSNKPTAAAKVRASIVKAQPKEQMKVVDISSDEEDEEAVQGEVEVEEIAEESVEEHVDMQVEEPVEERVEVEKEVRLDLQSKTKGKKKRVTEEEKSRLLGSNMFGGRDKEIKGNSSSLSVKNQTPAPSSSQSRDVEKSTQYFDDREQIQQSEDEYADAVDVSMQETDVPDAQLFESDAKMEDAIVSIEAPRTPSRANFPAQTTGFGGANSSQDLGDSKSSLEHKSPALEDKESKQPHPTFFPPLSKMPFVPLPELTEAELDMTVEEWIRYQMEVEYDKFRRDGERELQRFRQRGEEVRKAINGL